LVYLLVENIARGKDIEVSPDDSSSARRGGHDSDARMAERRGRRLALSCRLFFFGEEEFEGEATILDISTNGCRATSLTEVKVGLSLKLSLFLKDQQWPLRIDEALVRWVDGQTFGLEFVGIRPAQRERLRTLIMKSNR
jgi:PilZ domain